MGKFMLTPGGKAVILTVYVWALSPKVRGTYMIRSNRLTKALEKLFWIYLFINPVLDIVNGFFISNNLKVGILDVEFVSTLGVTPSLIIRMLFLLVFVLYIFLVRDRESILTAIPIGLAWVLSVVSEYRWTGGVNFFIDAQYMARFCYNIVLLMVYTRVFARRWGYDGKDLKASLDAVITYTLILLSVSILIPAILGVGYNTYADRLGYRGNRGFFYAGNDVTAIMALLMPLCIVRVLRGREDSAKMSGKPAFLFLPALAAALSTNAMLIIGSKTAFLAILIAYLAIFAFVIVHCIRAKSLLMLRDFVLILAIFFVIFLILNLISSLQVRRRLMEMGEDVGPFRIGDIFNYSGTYQAIQDSAAATEIIAANEGLENAMFNGRTVKLADQFAKFRSGGLLVWLFGLGRGSQEVIIEMDLFEVLFYYGVFGFAAMLWLYVKLGVAFFRGLFSKYSITAFAAFIGLGITVGYLIIAGHVLFSVTSGFYLSFALVYSRVLFADRPEEILLWKKQMV